MYEGQSIQLCQVCDERIRSNPFTRVVGDECFLYCSSDCMHKHWTHQEFQKQQQSRIDFGTV